jgi:predicted metal-binding membrane protein
VLFVGSWVAMTVAMMLPSSVPLLTIFRRLTRTRRDHLPLVLLVIGGYLGAWALFGGLAFAGTRLSQDLARAAAWRPVADRWAPPVLFVLAGAFQFSPLKYRCLDACRSPLAFVMSHWRGAHERWQSFRLGWDHGVFCVGCCWALMLLMFAFSSAHLLWMLALGTIMAVEKNAPWGRTIAAPTGAAFLAIGVVLALRG